MQRRPSPQCLIPCGLWSLADMLDHWGYKFLAIGTALGYVEVRLQNHRTEANGSLIGHGTSTVDPGSEFGKFARAKINEIRGLAKDMDLGAIPRNLRVLEVKFLQADSYMPEPVPLYTNDVLEDVERIKNDFLYILSERFFYYLPPDLAKLYGQPALFGEAVAKKFPAASDDIEWAGNCLALGQPTACVLHLNRAMEIAIHRMARKLSVTPDAKDNMGSMLGKMTEPIKHLPDKTEAQKRKKEKWAECRTNLYHVKMAWRDPSSHGKQSYDDKQARDIWDRVRGFMQQLATL
jgi:hypothetical protein